MNGSLGESLRPSLRECGVKKLTIYRPPDIISFITSTRLRWGGHVARMEETRSAFKMLIGQPTGRRLLGRRRDRWKENITSRIYLKEIGTSTRN